MTGFDNFDKATCYAQVSTISHIRENVGDCMCRFIPAYLEREKPDRFIIQIQKVFFWDSCGCTAAEVPDQSAYLKGQIMYGIETAKFEDEVFSL